jgi:hypothetical protein
MMPKRPTIVTLDPVTRGDWVFKVSHCPESDIICVFSWNHMLLWSNVRFFYEEEAAKNWLDYLELQTAGNLNRK